MGERAEHYVCFMAKASNEIVNPIRRVAVYCGSSSGNRPEYGAAATETGRVLASRGLELVYGGGKVGLMGTLADSVLANGGIARGVITESLLHAEIGHDRLTSIQVVGSMHERKAMMADLADAFLVLPGGFGTLDELCEVLTWTQLGIHRKPVALVNTCHYWDPFIEMAEKAAAEGFMKTVHRDLVRTAPEPAAAIELLLAPLPLPEPKWLT
jgi:uncharacterized protein (TIGR00730 family)